NLISRFMILGCAVWFYLLKAFVPIDLSFVYPRWSLSTSAPLNWLPLLGLAAAIALVWKKRNGGGRGLLSALGYYVLTLLPMLGLLNIYFMKYSFVADHWQYASLPAAMAVPGAVLGSRIERVSTNRKAWALGVAVLLLATLFVMTRRRAA